MLAFLAITTIINIALGYALAVYLEKAKARAEDAGPGAVSARSLPTRRLANQEAPAETPAAPTSPTVAPISADLQPITTPAPPIVAVESRPKAHDAPSVPESASTLSEEVAAALAGEAGLADADDSDSPTDSAPAVVEQELLAGIEEFRSQLAQLKTAAPAAAPA